MRAYDLILKKRDGGSLSPEELDFLVGGFARGEVPEGQIAAWLMAVFFRGMTRDETVDLTMTMVRSGKTLDLSCVEGTKVDKHSTGGVGDKTTLVLMPLLAAAGIPVVKMSGRSLGFTGGTLDKLESIPGFSVALTPDRMIDQARRIGIVLAGQTLDLVPADKKIYALRDQTATVDCLPLIAASVMSKKIAAGADAIVLDVKAGSGAFMKEIADAEALARIMVEIGTKVGRSTVAAITNMDQPLGRAVGNALEVAEAIRTLQGDGPDDLVELCAVLGGLGLFLGGKAASRADGEKMIDRLIADGRGIEKFREWVSAQEGDPRVSDDLSLLPKATLIKRVAAGQSGSVAQVDALTIAEAATALGAGRGSAGASPDLSVGVVLMKKIGDSVKVGEPIAEIHACTDTAASESERLIIKAYKFSGQQVTPPQLVYGIVS